MAKIKVYNGSSIGQTVTLKGTDCSVSQLSIPSGQSDSFDEADLVSTESELNSKGLVIVGRQVKEEEPAPLTEVVSVVAEDPSTVSAEETNVVETATSIDTEVVEERQEKQQIGRIIQNGQKNK